MPNVQNIAHHLPSPNSNSLPIPANLSPARDTRSESLSQPITQLGLPKLRQIVHALLTQINALQLRDVLCRCSADTLHDDGGIRFEDDAVVDDLVDSEGDKVVVFDYGAFVYRLPIPSISTLSSSIPVPFRQIVPKKATKSRW